MYSRDKLFLRSLECYFAVNFPRCFATREINNKITLSWTLKQFVTRVHTLFSISPAFLLVILTLSLKNESHITHSSFINCSSLIDIHKPLHLFYYWFRRGFYPKCLLLEGALVYHLQVDPVWWTSLVEPAWRLGFIEGSKSFIIFWTTLPTTHNFSTLHGECFHGLDMNHLC